MTGELPGLHVRPACGCGAGACGGRSALAAQAAMDMGLSPVVKQTGGVGAWKKAGGTLE